MLTKQNAQELCDALELYSEFFDETNEEYILLNKNNPSLLNAFSNLYALAYGDD